MCDEKLKVIFGLVLIVGFSYFSVFHLGDLITESFGDDYKEKWECVEWNHRTSWDISLTNATKSQIKYCNNGVCFTSYDKCREVNGCKVKTNQKKTNCIKWRKVRFRR